MTIERAKVISRVEAIRPGMGEVSSLGQGVSFRELVSGACSARGFSTGIVTIDPGAVLPYHIHSVCEALTILNGAAVVRVEGRAYRLKPFDCICIPAGVAHQISNYSGDSALIALSAAASPAPAQEPVSEVFADQDRGLANPDSVDPESIVRFADAEVYELSTHAEFRDLFAGRLGSVGICGGYGRFEPGASLPCHVHEFDESITIVEGQAVCLVQGNRYMVAGYDTAFVPEGRPHRFLNHSSSSMAMIWVYAGSEPGRTLVESGYCDGTLAWSRPTIDAGESA
jgi:quercetin dioxygenase-like cupin family protein